jgi:hypothetical protein
MKLYETGENWSVRGFITNYSWNDEFKEDEMTRECSMNKGEEESVFVISGKVGTKETTRKTKT